MAAAVTYWPSLFETTGSVVETEWDELFDRFSTERDFTGDDKHAGWSAAVFDPPKRGLENVRRVTAIVLDYDDGETIDAAQALWGDCFGFIHTTRKHSPESPRFRVILPFTRDVSAFEYAAIWRRVFARSGNKLDPAPKDPSRFWYTPGTAAGYFETRRLTGEMLDPDKILSQPEPSPPRPATVVPIRRTTQSDWTREDRARAWVNRAAPAIQGSGGDAQTWLVARKLAADFGLDEATTFSILWNDYNPRCVPPWSRSELEHKAHDAAHKARVSYPVEDRRDADWEPPETPPFDGDDQMERDAIESEPELEPEQHSPSVAEIYGIKSMADLLGAVLERAETGESEIGVSTGNYELDSVIGGLRRKRVTVLGADTSFGKSSFAIMVADEAERAKVNALLISAEDGDDTYGQRLMARRSRVNAFCIRDNSLTEEQIKKMRAQVAKAENHPFFLDAIGKPAEHMANAITHIAREIDLQLVIVDYVQAFTCVRRCQDRRTEVTHIARVFADAIKNANAAGLILSQLKRPESEIRPPTMHELKESGDLENMAEHVLLGHLESEGEGTGRVDRRYFYIGKNKDGPRNVDKIEMPFDSATASFKTVRGEVYRPPPHPSDEFMSDDWEDG